MLCYLPTDTEICPVTALVSHMMVRGTEPGPLFTQVDGRYLTRNYLVLYSSEDSIDRSMPNIMLAIAFV